MIRIPYLFLLLLLTSCAGSNTHLPELTVISGGTDTCLPLFPQGNYQFVHLIEFSMPGSHGTAMGVTVITDNTIESALMTVEGFSLFAASFSDTLTVRRAVPPFDKPGFAAGMMGDIRSIFLLPRGTTVTGSLAGNSEICRITEHGGQTTDILITTGNCRQIKMYSSSGRLLRTISGRDCSADLNGIMIPRILELTSGESGGYFLKMTLISANNTL